MPVRADVDLWTHHRNLWWAYWRRQLEGDNDEATDSLYLRLWVNWEVQSYFQDVQAPLKVVRNAQHWGEAWGSSHPKEATELIRCKEQSQEGEIQGQGWQRGQSRILLLACQQTFHLDSVFHARLAPRDKRNAELAQSLRCRSVPGGARARAVYFPRLGLIWQTALRCAEVSWRLPGLLQDVHSNPRHWRKTHPTTKRWQKVRESGRANLIEKLSI